MNRAMNNQLRDIAGPIRKSARHLSLSVAAFALLLSACGEDDIVLPGPRQDVRSVLQNPELGATEVDLPVPENTARGLALPAMKNNSSWTQGTGTPSSRVVHPALRAGPQLAWSADIGEGDARKQRITADPVVSGGRVFTLDASALVTATSTTGATLWTRDLTPPNDGQTDATGGGLAVDGATLYVSIGFGKVSALDTSTGGIRWTQDLDATGSGAPTVYGDLVYFTSGDDTGWALRKTDGLVQWQTGTSPSVRNVLGAPPPAIVDDIAIMAFGSGEVRGLFRRGGLNRWNASVVGRRPGRALSSISDVTGAPVVSGKKVYVGNQSGRLAALESGSGARLWTAREGVIGPVWPAGDSVFALTDLNELVRLDAGDGRRIWGTPLPNFIKDRPRRQVRVYAHHGPIIAGGRVIVASSDGQLRSFDPRNGALVGSVEIPGGASTAPVVAGSTLYVVSKSGKLHAFR